MKRFIGLCLLVLLSKTLSAEVALPDILSDYAVLFHPAEASLDTGKKTIRVRSEQVKHPVAVRYCFQNFQPGNLKNHRGMPVVPFRTDHW